MEKDLSKESEINLIEILFTQKLDDLSLRTSGHAKAPVRIIIGQENNIVRVMATPQFIKDTKPYGNFNTLSQDEIKRQIIDGKGTVIDVSTERIVADQAKVIEKTIISRTILEYRYDGKTGLALPYLRLEGTSEVELNNQASVVILIPLIDSKYFVGK